MPPSEMETIRDSAVSNMAREAIRMLGKEVERKAWDMFWLGFTVAIMSIGLAGAVACALYVVAAS